MNRLVERASALRARGERGLAPYVTAGDGGFDATLAVLRACDRAGAACVELGIPFSDPIADGPVLQQSAQRALRGGATFDGAMESIARLRRGSDGEAPSAMPVLVMSYVNPLLVRGWSRTMRAIADAGGDGVLVADLPVEESDEMRAAAADAELATVFFVAPTTSDERTARAVRASRGFVYAIGRFGVTGAATELDDGAQAFLARVRAAAGDLPVAVGFGIQDARGVRAATRAADLAIVGSALMAHVHRARVRCQVNSSGVAAETPLLAEALLLPRTNSPDTVLADAAAAAGRAAYECVRALSEGLAR